MLRQFISGDGVNVVARLQEVAEPGTIVVSGSVFEQIRGRIEVPSRDLGDLALRNIRRPVHGYRLLESTAPVVAPPLFAATSRRASIAVLPFAEPDQPSAQRYFGDGVVEDVVAALAGLPDLFVISRSSTLRFTGIDADVAAVGRELGVRYVLTGSVRRAGDRIRIAAELADAETREILWTERVDGSPDDLFALQDRLSERTVTTIAPHLREAEIRRARRKRTENLDAYDFMLRGLDLLYRLRREEFDRARDLFGRSIELDSNYAAPYAHAALWHSIRIGQGWSPDVDADYAAVTELATAAVERDRLDASALALCGHVRALRLRDLDGAFALFDRALAACPNSSVAWVRSSPAYSYAGDGAEARRRGEAALRLSPLDPHLFYAHAVLALAAYTAGDFEDAVRWGRRAMSAQPAFTANLRVLAASLGAAGRPVEAREIAQALLRVEPDFRIAGFAERYAYRDAGRRTLLARHLAAAGLPE